MRHVLVTVGMAVGLCLSAGPAMADIAFPARLDVVESETGLYDVTFTLPIVEGRKLRAEPRMPPICVEVSPRETGASSGGVTTTWSVQCEPASLAGEAILVEGLIGTQTDLAFTLTTLDGRIFSQILRPSRPGFLVPEPPSFMSLAAVALVEGLRQTVHHLGLWILLAVASLLRARPRDLFASCGAFVVGHLLAQWAVGHGWIEIASPTRGLLVWAAVALPAMKLAGGVETRKSWLVPLWPVMLLIGLLIGGAQPEALPADGLSSSEQLLALVFFVVGAGAAVLLMAAVALELRAVLLLTGGGRWTGPAFRTAGYVAGSLAVGLVLAHLVGLALGIGDIPRPTLGYILLAVVLGPSCVLAGRRRIFGAVPFVALAVLGALPGLFRVPLPMAPLFTLGLLIVFGGALAVGRPLRRRWVVVLAAIAVPAHAWSVAMALEENVSRSTAATMGVVLVGFCVFYGSLAWAKERSTCDPSVPVRILGAVVAAVAIGWRLLDYRSWFDLEVATEAALGLARVPVLALVLAGLAVLLWPRRRRVAEKLGVAGGSQKWHLVLIGGALMLVPYGTVTMRLPFFEPHAPRGQEARRVASRVLSDTYHAFNLQDEDRLYDTLADSVVEDLIDEIYLDSRRRLTAGTREGTQVKVRDVGVLEIGEPRGGVSAEEGFSYDCTWRVVARVQHLQHVHHRHNIYSGVVTLRSDDGRWKIAGVELLSEDRRVVPWQPT